MNRSGRPQSGWVYAIGCGEFIKVGLTRTSPQKRLKDLQTGQPHELELLGEWRTSAPEALESRVHEILRSQHHRGEWFTASFVEVSRAINDATGRTEAWPLIAYTLRSAWTRVTAAVLKAAAVSGAVMWLVLSFWLLARLTL